MCVDANNALARLNVRPLFIEDARNAARQMDELYVSYTVGFYKMRRDAAVVLDKTLNWGTGDVFPSWMDIEAFQRRTFK
jgi:hypothetical protein